VSPQLETLAEALDRGEALTVAEALTRYGIYALSQRAGELVRIGYPVTIRTIKTPTGKHISEYSKGAIAHG
jgi:hypothetical protein